MSDAAVVGYGLMMFSLGIVFGSGPRWWTSLFIQATSALFAAAGGLTLFVSLQAGR